MAEPPEGTVPERDPARAALLIQMASEELSRDRRELTDQLRASARQAFAVRPFPARSSGRKIPIVTRFAIQIVIGTFAFGLVAIAAALLNLLVNRVEAWGVSPYIILGLRTVEMLIFSADIVVMAIFVIVEALSLIRLLLAEGWKLLRPRKQVGEGGAP